MEITYTTKGKEWLKPLKEICPNIDADIYEHDGYDLSFRLENGLSASGEGTDLNDLQEDARRMLLAALQCKGDGDEIS